MENSLGKTFPKDRHVSFFSSQRTFLNSAGWEIHHEASAHILVVSHKVASQGQQHISAPAVPDGPSDAHKDSRFPSRLSWRKHRKGLH